VVVVLHCPVLVTVGNDNNVYTDNITLSHMFKCFRVLFYTDKGLQTRVTDYLQV